MKRIIVSGADARYFLLLAELHASLRDRGVLAGTAFGVLDCGLTAAQRGTLVERGALVVDAVWDGDFPLRAELERVRPGLKAMTSRPLLPELFPGFELFLWLDADTWLQSPEIVELFFATAAGGTLAAVMELDRSYPFVRDAGRYWENMREWCAAASGSATTARFMAHRPTINSGAFALAAGAGHWAPWRRATRSWYALQTALSHPTSLVEQFALNFVVYRGGFPFVPLPARCNWLCHLALPAWDPASGRLCDPLPPHEPIGLVHVCDWTKNMAPEVPGVDGMPRRMRLTYPPRVQVEDAAAAKNAAGRSAG
ncbi:MAG: hypothetical protein IT561_00030 [Alphaproteobacteria bacterium]|nr:hypothetical protein [Alphaproteobacteria bacterium]